MTRLCDIFGTVLRKECPLGQVEMVRHGTDDITDSRLMRLYSHDMAHHFLREGKVNLFVSKRRMGEKRRQDPLQVTYRVLYILRNEINDLIRQSNAVAAHLVKQDILAQLIVRACYLRRQTILETCKQAFLDILEFHRSTVASEDELFAQLLEMVEDMEERVLRALEPRKILDVIHDKHIHRLIEIQEIRDAVCLGGILVLEFESVRADIEHAELRVDEPCLVSDSIGEVCLPHSASAIYKKRVESRRTGLLGDSDTRRTRQFVGFSGNERVKGI